MFRHTVPRPLTSAVSREHALARSRKDKPCSLQRVLEKRGHKSRKPTREPWQIQASLTDTISSGVRYQPFSRRAIWIKRLGPGSRVQNSKAGCEAATTRAHTVGPCFAPPSHPCHPCLTHPSYFPTPLSDAAPPNRILQL